MSNVDPTYGIIHGYVLAIGLVDAPSYFTGVSYSVNIDDAQVFNTKGGAKRASRYWQYADSNSRPLPQTWFDGRRAVAVSLKLEGPML